MPLCSRRLKHKSALDVTRDKRSSSGRAPPLVCSTARIDQHADGCTAFIQGETEKEKGTGTEKMNVFSFDFQLVAGTESSISLSAIRTESSISLSGIRTEHFKRTRVLAEE